ncbi:DUF4235 domain-containing protein [Kitasatospora sp. HPMI-4]|uniref:DUF4235 domain-containing protein n=1 Tax=Kitasatospora sp. HPMI-4 TaxID=3448443 RepID=UPI003F1A5F1F
MNLTKIAYKPVGLLLGALSGVIAGAAFKLAWKFVAHEENAPQATDEHRDLRRIMVAAALQGAIFAAVKAAVDRCGAAATRRIAGTWPG